MTEIAAFATAVSHAINIAKAIVETHDEMKLRDLKLEFTTSLLDVSQKQLALTESYQAHLDANEQLKQQLAAYERWEQESQRYHLHQPAPGLFVYTLKPEHAAGQPPHWICAVCYEERKKSVLQRAHKGSDLFQCQRDAAHQVDLSDYS